MADEWVVDDFISNTLSVGTMRGWAHAVPTEDWTMSAAAVPGNGNENVSRNKVGATRSAGKIFNSVPNSTLTTQRNKNSPTDMQVALEFFIKAGISVETVSDVSWSYVSSQL